LDVSIDPSPFFSNEDKPGNAQSSDTIDTLQLMKEIATWLRELFSPIKMFAMNHITVKSVKSIPTLFQSGLGH